MKSWLFLLVSVFFFFCSSAQTPKDALQVLRDSFPQEKIHVHFDRQAYASGETLFFKAYLLSGFFPSALSANFFAELTDEQGNVKGKVKLPVLSGTVSGSLSLPEDLPAGHYQFKAYTPWMLNFDPGFLYTKWITVYNDRTIATARPAAAGKEIVGFFPEGGNLVAGVVNVVAFKVTDAQGLPLMVTGSILDSEGKEVTSLSTLHDGMGYFGFLPQAENSYSARIRFPDQSEKQYPLPAFSTIPWAMQVREEGEDRRRIALIGAAPVKEKKLILVAQMQQELLFEQEVPVQGNTALLVVDTRNFPGGILQLTALTERGEPLAERLIFIHHTGYRLPLELKKENTPLSPRSRNSISFTLPDSLTGSFSVSVVDAGRVPADAKGEDIVSRFLLTGDINGYIHNPAYYLSSTEKKVRQATDLLLMTQGWRRFTWAQVMKKQFPFIAFRDRNYIEIQGSAQFSSSKKPATEGFMNVMLRTKDSLTDFFQVPVRSDGRFLMENLVFADTAMISYQWNSTKSREKELKLSLVSDSAYFNTLQQTALSLSLVKMPAPLYSIPDSLRVKFSFTGDTSGTFKELTAVTVTAAKKRPVEELNKKYATGLFSSMNMVRVLDLVNNDPGAGALNVFQYIQGRLPGIMVQTGGFPPSYQVFSRRAMNITGGLLPIPIYLNEVAAEPNQLLPIPMSQVAMIKYFQTGFMGNSSVGTTQALVVYTKKGEDAKASTFSYLNGFRYPGYSVVKEYFQPDYESRPRQFPQPDRRVTLLWQPELEPESGTNRYIIRFFNSDFARKVHVVVEGMTTDGKLIHEEADLQ